MVDGAGYRSRIPYLYPLAVHRLAADHDVVVLVEGSTFKDNWSSALLYLYLLGAWRGQRAGKATVAYAVEAGRMGAVNRWLTRRVASRMDLVIVRNEASRQRLAEIGVDLGVQVAADTAFLHPWPVEPVPTDRPVVGLAPVELNWWPVRIRPFGRRELCYHWPYYHSWSQERARRSEELVGAWTALIDHIVNVRGWTPRLIAMEALDQRICQQILAAMPPRVRAMTETTFAGPGVVAGGHRRAASARLPRHLQVPRLRVVDRGRRSPGRVVPRRAPGDDLRRARSRRVGEALVSGFYVDAGPTLTETAVGSDGVASVADKQRQVDHFRTQMEDTLGIVSITIGFAVTVLVLFITTLVHLSISERRASTPTCAHWGSRPDGSETMILSTVTVEVAAGAALSIPLAFSVALLLNDRMGRAWFAVHLHPRPMDFALRWRRPWWWCRWWRCSGPGPCSS